MRKAGDGLRGSGSSPLAPLFEVYTGWAFEIADPWCNVPWLHRPRERAGTGPGRDLVEQHHGGRGHDPGQGSVHDGLIESGWKGSQQDGGEDQQAGAVINIYGRRFYQTVIGVGATASGYYIWPLVVGVMAGSIGSGVLITRVGRYNWLLVAGGLILLVGAFLMTGGRP